MAWLWKHCLYCFAYVLSGLAVIWGGAVYSRLAASGCGEYRQPVKVRRSLGRMWDIWGSVIRVIQ